MRVRVRVCVCACRALLADSVWRAPLPGSCAQAEAQHTDVLDALVMEACSKGYTREDILRTLLAVQCNAFSTGMYYALVSAQCGFFFLHAAAQLVLAPNAAALRPGPHLAKASPACRRGLCQCGSTLHSCAAGCAWVCVWLYTWVRGQRTPVL